MQYAYNDQQAFLRGIGVNVGKLKLRLSFKRIPQNNIAAEQVNMYN